MKDVSYNDKTLIKIGKDIIGDNNHNHGKYLTMYYLNDLFIDYFNFKNIDILNTFKPQINISRWMAAYNWMIQINIRGLVQDFLCWYLNNYLIDESKNKEEYLASTTEKVSDWNWTLQQKNLMFFLKDNKYCINKTNIIEKKEIDKAVN
ncbi:MAG: hypothetical protein KFW07_00735, partial [Mycoplasmataceae bacterium]|nr:hypothetical protein [Mycoplasmataceae bacterium]